MAGFYRSLEEAFGDNREEDIPGFELDDGFDDCITEKLINGDPIEDCFGDGEPISIWPNGGGGGCARRLLVLTDRMVGDEWKDLENFLVDYIGRCRPPLIKIQFHGTYWSMRSLGLLTPKVRGAKKVERFARLINTGRPKILFQFDFFQTEVGMKERLYLV
ncbi:uncharacterized protein METZ01_LOCUS496150 [marine metagenome]|uniref:Uncharacterized protein n=1 Tax=marine metagenome TaxID=408172 RepID=A0A383DFN5_9ZZZZ